MNKILILMMAAMPLMYSCSKDNDNGTPPPDPALVNKLQKDVAGKWIYEDVTLKENMPPPRVMSPGSGNGNRELGVQTPVYNKGFIEFLSDSTYVIVDSKHNTFVGKYKAVS